MNNSLKKAAAVVTTVFMLSGTAGYLVANAQGPTGSHATGAQPPRVAPLVCSTTNYTDIAAKALNMDSTALRQALVGGKTVEQLATASNVTLQTVTDALKTAQAADLAQALKDGLLTQQQYDQIKSRMDAQPATQPRANATPPATQQVGPNGNPAGGRPSNGGRGFGGLMRSVRVPAFNQVFPFDVAAKAIGISCPDL